MKILLQIAILPLPWPLRRRLLQWIFGYRIAPTARIRWSIIMADKVEISSGAHIGSLTFVKGLSELRIEENSRLGNLNWVTGLGASSRHFVDQPDRRSALIVRANASITHRHLIDCTDQVEVGSFTTVGGWGTQILTHSIDVASSRQRSGPVKIGQYTFVGTRAVFLKGSELPDYSILSAGSVLAHKQEATHTLYSGVPAEPVRPLRDDLAYFSRSTVGVI